MSQQHPDAFPQRNVPFSSTPRDIVHKDNSRLLANNKQYQHIMEQSHRLRETLSIKHREHMARPYPGGNFDFLAINVPSSYQQGMIPDGEEPPWGMLRVVAASREKFGFNSGILDAHRLRLQPGEIKEQIIKTKAKLVGINPTSVNILEGMAVAQACDELGIPYILGGIHATLDPAIAKEDFPTAFAFIRGNGESAIAEVLQVILNGSPRSYGNGIYYRDTNFVKRVDYAKKLNPDDIPLIKQDVYIEEPIYTHHVQVGGIEREIHEATLFVTDGCPFECTFCSSPIMVNRGRDIPYARPPMSRIVDEIESVINLGCDAIHFLDDMAFIKGENIIDFHHSLVKRDLVGKFIWRGLTRAPVILRKEFTAEVMTMMKETGSWKIALGIESGSDEVLRKIRKRVTKEQVIAAVTKLAAYDIQAKGFFIMGFPEETEDQIRETRQFIDQLKSIGLTEIAVFQFKPYPGTLEYQQLLRMRPDIINDLTYLRRDLTGLADKARYRAEQKDVWLPDDLSIAEIPSGKVREYVLDALQSFYGTSLEYNLYKDSSCS